MSLRFQINIYVIVSSVLILFIGSTLVLWQAKKSVEKEVNSSISLAKQLIKLSSANLLKTKQNEAYWLDGLMTLEQTRHLTIELKSPSGGYQKLLNKAVLSGQEPMPPKWFINLISVEPAIVKYEIKFNESQPQKFIIKADPLDEIREVWQESLTFFSILLLLTLLTSLTINLAFNKSLKSILSIINNLKRIEAGDYGQKLPVFSSSEYNKLAKAINHMTDVMARTEQENRELTLRSLNIQEEERRHLSQELHDELGQSITAIKAMAVTANHKQVKLYEITDSIKQICDHLITVVRNMMHQLHPLTLTELGLKAALEELLHYWLAMHPELAMTLKYSNHIDCLNSNTAIQVYRIIQECLTNSIRHAEAKKISVELKLMEQNTKLFILTVDDDGIGCELESTEFGFGLRSMQDRIKTLSGEFIIKSKPGDGMMVIAKIPLT